MVHERSTGGSSRSSWRSGSEASSSRAPPGRARAASASSARSSKSDSEHSVASAPPRRIDWDQVHARAHQQGAPHRQRERSFQRAHSEDVLGQRCLPGQSPSRRLRAPGTCGPGGDAKAKRDSSSDREASSDRFKELLSNRDDGSEPPYRRLRRSAGAGAPPPCKTPWAEHPAVEALEPAAGGPPDSYRRVRSARGITPPPEKLSMPLGAQRAGHDRVFPAPWDPLTSKQFGAPPSCTPRE